MVFKQAKPGCGARPHVGAASPITFSREKTALSKAESRKWTRSATPLVATRRLPGQSLRDQQERLLDNRVIPFCFATAGLWVLWLVMEFQARSPRPPQPTLYLCAAIIATGACAIVFGRLWGQFGRLNRGECGDICVAERLEEPRWRGFQ